MEQLELLLVQPARIDIIKFRATDPKCMVNRLWIRSNKTTDVNEQKRLRLEAKEIIRKHNL